MLKPFEDGWGLIKAGEKRRREEALENIYYHAVANGINDKYKTFRDFKRAMISDIPEKTKTQAEIMADVKNILDSFQ